MPMLTMRPTDRCVVCGYRLRGFRIATYRINKRSLVSPRGGLVFVEPTCAECGHPTPITSERWQLEAESQAVVDAYRKRKGWA